LSHDPCRRLQGDTLPVVNTQKRYTAATAALAAITGLVLAGCSTAASTSASAPATAGTAPSSGITTSGAKTSGANSGSTPGVVPTAALAFPVAVGNTWVYTSAIPSVGSSGTVTDKILSVTPAPTGKRVAESYTNSLLSTTARDTYVFHSDGSITLPLNQMSGGTLSSPTGGIVLPPAAVITSGRPYRYNLTIGFKEGGTKLTETAQVTVQGAGTATVTVPAGTFSATIIDMTMAWTMASYTVTIEIKDWFANGTGTVKSEALIHEADVNEVTSTEELKSFTRG
jgi:hypothetical protein